CRARSGSFSYFTRWTAWATHPSYTATDRAMEIVDGRSPQEHRPVIGDTPHRPHIPGTSSGNVSSSHTSHSQQPRIPHPAQVLGYTVSTTNRPIDMTARRMLACTKVIAISSGKDHVRPTCQPVPSGPFGARCLPAGRRADPALRCG